MIAVKVEDLQRGDILFGHEVDYIMDDELHTTVFFTAGFELEMMTGEKVKVERGN